MKIPEHVKKQAMDAVAGLTSTAEIRAFSMSGISVLPATDFRPSDLSMPLVKSQPMDVMADPVTQAQIRLLRETGFTTPPLTLVAGRGLLADKVARMYGMGMGMNSIHRQITRDGFERDYV